MWYKFFTLSFILWGAAFLMLFAGGESAAQSPLVWLASFILWGISLVRVKSLEAEDGWIPFMRPPPPPSDIDEQATTRTIEQPELKSYRTIKITLGTICIFTILGIWIYAHKPFNLGRDRVSPEHRRICNIVDSAMSYTNPGLHDIFSFEEAFVTVSDVGDPVYSNDLTTQFEVFMLARYDTGYYVTIWGPAKDGEALSGGPYGVIGGREPTIDELNDIDNFDVRLTESGCS